VNTGMHMQSRNMKEVSAIRPAAAIPKWTRPIRQPGVGVRLGLIVVLAMMALHCAAMIVLLIHATRFVIRLGSAGATVGLVAPVAALIRTGPLLVALTLLASGAALVYLRQTRVAIRIGDDRAMP
jgi:hypothetical protein